MKTRTSRKHPFEIFDGSKVDETRADDFGELGDFGGDGGHDGGGTEGEGRVGRIWSGGREKRWKSGVQRQSKKRDKGCVNGETNRS